MRFLKPIYLLAMAGLAGCTSNNGNIGDWFGTWHLLEIKVDGTADPAYQGNIFWQFQSDVINMTELTLGGYHDRTNHWGIWSQQGKTLCLDYNHPVAPGSTTHVEEFEPPTITRLPLESTLTIDHFTSSRLTVTYQAPETTYQYILKKQ